MFYQPILGVQRGARRGDEDENGPWSQDEKVQAVDEEWRTRPTNFHRWLTTYDTVHSCHYVKVLTLCVCIYVYIYIYIYIYTYREKFLCKYMYRWLAMPVYIKNYFHNVLDCSVKTTKTKSCGISAIYMWGLLKWLWEETRTLLKTGRMLHQSLPGGSLCVRKGLHSVVWSVVSDIINCYTSFHSFCPCLCLRWVTM